jgi:hypothetical protein
MDPEIESYSPENSELYVLSRCKISRTSKRWVGESGVQRWIQAFVSPAAWNGGDKALGKTLQLSEGVA